MDIKYILKNTLLIVEDTAIIYKKDINIKSKKSLKKDKGRDFMTIAQAVAQRIIELCDNQGITINALAIRCGITQSTLGSIMNGKSKNPRLETIRKICAGLNISIFDFFNSSFFENSNLDELD